MTVGPGLDLEQRARHALGGKRAARATPDPPGVGPQGEAAARALRFEHRVRQIGDRIGSHDGRDTRVTGG